MNRALVVVGLRTALQEGGRKLATGEPPYLNTSLPSSRGYEANMASEGGREGGREGGGRREEGSRKGGREGDLKDYSTLSCKCYFQGLIYFMNGLSFSIFRDSNLTNGCCGHYSRPSLIQIAWDQHLFR